MMGPVPSNFERRYPSCKKRNGVWPEAAIRGRDSAHRLLHLRKKAQGVPGLSEPNPCHRPVFSHERHCTQNAQDERSDDLAAAPLEELETPIGDQLCHDDFAIKMCHTWHI
jgi:hypothetical protein